MVAFYNIQIYVIKHAHVHVYISVHIPSIAEIVR